MYVVSWANDKSSDTETLCECFLPSDTHMMHHHMLCYFGAAYVNVTCVKINTTCHNHNKCTCIATYFLGRLCCWQYIS